MKELKTVILLMLYLTGIMCIQYDYDPQSSFMKLFSIFEQDNVTVPDIKIPDVTAQPATNEQPEIQVITIPDLSRSIGLDLDNDEEAIIPAASSSPAQPPAEVTYDWFPSRRSMFQTQTSDPAHSCSKQTSEINPNFARSAATAAVSITPPETVGNQQQRANFGTLLQQPQPLYTISTVSNSAPTMVQDANAPVAAVPIYDRIQFPCFVKSGATTSRFPLPDAAAAQQTKTRSNSDFDCGCKPLVMGDSCLFSLLQDTSFFYAALKSTGIMDFICLHSSATVLAPTNKSFAQLAYELGIIPEDLLLPQNKDVFVKILRLHIFLEEEISPSRFLARSTLFPELLTTWLQQRITVKTDVQDNAVTFRPPTMLAPPAYLLFQNSGEDIFLQQNCKVDYYYVIQNVLIPNFD